MTRAWLEVRGLDVDTPEGRPLLRGLRLSLGDEAVAVVGRNGVGKSTLLGLLAGRTPDPAVVRRGRVVLVPQEPDVAGLARAAALVDRPGWRRGAAEAGLRDLAELMAGTPSRGELRKVALLAAFVEEPDVLLLDEPTDDLDAVGLAWLLRQVRTWRRGLMVVSHDAALLSCFQDFFVMAESGCRCVSGGLAALDAALAQEQRDREARYVSHLHQLAAREAHDLVVRRRRARKKVLGRLHELKRCTSRMRLNTKRSGAQVSQARVAKVRDDRIGAVRRWARATRRALRVELPLELGVPTLGLGDGAPVVSLEGVTVVRGGVTVLRGLDLRVGRERLAVTGPNGAGKSTLLEVMTGQLQPDLGRARTANDRVGYIDQGAVSWRCDESLITRLSEAGPAATADGVAGVVVAHRFPLALATRPMRSLSPGERTRAALICLFERRPAVELLVLDEPTNGLDRVAVAALVDALRRWPGGLVVASHDAAFVAAVGVERVVAM